MFHKKVFCVETGEEILLLPNADTATMRGNFTYVSVDEDRVEEVSPCAGRETEVTAYWRGLPGGEARARELHRQALANAHSHKL